MKNIIKYTSILSIVLMFVSCENNLDSPVSPNPDLKANSKVIVELFSNVMCVACIQSANYCDDISFLKGITINDTNVIIINIHTSLFPGDPFYAFNPQMNRAREVYYGALFNPMGFLMGSIMTAPFSQEQWTNQINQRLNKTNDITINLSNVIDTVSKSGTLFIQAAQLSGTTQSNLKLHIAITEGNLYYNSPNGKTLYHNILRQMITSSGGEDISVTPGQTLNIVKNYNIDNRIIPNNSQLIVFIQNDSTKEILGAEKVKL
ncbi:MAG: Omp28-related outer membrane protein [Ignavibacteria bacterium]|nr:Omp28-related outer membrane protein [Ignavibacteria bacterium]